MPSDISGYEFRYTLEGNKVSCRYATPQEPDNRTADGEIRREPYLDTIVLLEQWLKRWEWIAKLDGEDGRLLVPDTFRVLGDNLWNLAFNDGAPGRILLDTRDHVRRMHAAVAPTIRVRISFGDQAADLAALPWEFVRHPGPPGFYLAAETSLVLGRYLDSFKEHDGFRCADTKLRVLFVMTLPADPMFDEERRAYRSLVSELTDPPGGEGSRTDSENQSDESRLDMRAVDGWNAVEVMNRLAEFKQGRPQDRVDVVHLVALCRTSGNRPLLYLPNDHGGGSSWMEPESLVQVLIHDTDNRPELVVLHLCDWRDEGPEHFEQLAPAFIKEGIPAVLAMQYPMQPATGREFIKTFYQALAKGDYIGKAVQSARRNMLITHGRRRYFGTPVLYMQSKVDGNLITRRIIDEDPPVATEGAGLAPRVTPERGRPARLTDVRQVLLSELDEIQPQTRTVVLLQDWVESRRWPARLDDDLDKVQKVLRAKRRELNDNTEADQICRRLLRKVRELSESG